MKDKIKNGLIIVLIVLIGLFGFFGGKAVKKYAEDITLLKNANTTLETQKAFLETQVKIEQANVADRDCVIDSCMSVFRKKDKQIAGLSANLDSALARLNGITSDSSYQFLQRVAYVYPGVLEYLFNALQVKGIHVDYLKARSSEQIIPAYQAQVANCKFQLIEKDSIETGLKRIVLLRNQELANCEQVNENDKVIIKDTEKQRDKERRRKNFWRFTTAVSTTVLIIVSAFGL